MYQVESKRWKSICSIEMFGIISLTQENYLAREDGIHTINKVRGNFFFTTLHFGSHDTLCNQKNHLKHMHSTLSNKNFALLSAISSPDGARVIFTVRIVAFVVFFLHSSYPVRFISNFAFSTILLQCESLTQTADTDSVNVLWICSFFYIVNVAFKKSIVWNKIMIFLNFFGNHFLYQWHVENRYIERHLITWSSLLESKANQNKSIAAKKGRKITSNYFLSASYFISVYFSLFLIESANNLVLTMRRVSALKFVCVFLIVCQKVCALFGHCFSPHPSYSLLHLKIVTDFFKCMLTRHDCDFLCT